MLSITSLANNTVTRNGTMMLSLNASEPLAGFLVLQPSTNEWAKVNATAGELMLTAYGEGLQQAAMKGESSNITGS
jgi:hypothetical protein